ncbi:ylyB [Symbiodinium sp. CCMP2456]|nr:ylyB [Symbiodinium sp. CCMP2456]
MPSPGLQLPRTKSSAVNRPCSRRPHLDALARWARAGRWGQVAKVLARMEQAGIEPAVASFNIIVSAAASAMHWLRALQAATEGRDAGIPGDAVGQTSVLHLCKQLRRWQLAVHHLQSLPLLGVQCNAIHVHVVLSSLPQEDWPKTVALFRELSLQGVTLDAVARRPLLRSQWQHALAEFAWRCHGDLASASSFTAACSAAGVWTQALVVCQRLRGHADRICFNSAASAFERSGPWQFAVRLFVAPTKNEAPDETGLASAQIAVSSGGAWRARLQLLEHAQHQALRPHLMLSTFDPGTLRSTPCLWLQVLEFRAGHAEEFAASAEGLQEASRWIEACDLLIRLAASRADQANSWRVAMRRLTVVMSAQTQTWQRSLAALTAAKRSGLRPATIHHDWGVSALEKGLQWEGACELLGLMPSRRMSPRAQGCNAGVAACAKGEQWPMSLRWILCMSKDTLTPDEMSLGSFICAAGAHAWRQVLGLLLCLDPMNSLWSPTFFPWALAKLGCRTPRAAEALARAVQWPLSAAEVTSSAWAAANLGIFGPGITHQLEKQVMQCHKNCTLEELRVVTAAGAALNLGQRLFRAIAEEAERRMLSMKVGCAADKDWQDLLGIVRALHSIDLLPERLHRLTKACFCAETVDAASFSQGPDPVVLEKPAGWEVYGGHGQLQLRDKLIRSAGNYPIFHDAARDFGFIHRLDVPSSGLILAAKTYRTHSYLQLQLHTGVLLREYFVVSHGWLTPARRAISAALDDDAETTRAGIGKAALTKLKVQVQCHLEGEAFTAVAVQLGTGRKHQIRSHLAHVGHPVARDGRYSSSASFRGDGSLCNSNFLHRQRLAFFDSSGKWHDAKAPLPSLLATALESLHERRATSTGLLQQCTGDVQSWDVATKGDRRVVYARLMAIRALAPLAASGNKRAIDSVVAGLKDQHTSVREGALEELAKIASNGDSVNGGELSARLSAVKALAAETSDSAVAAVLGNCLEDWHAAVQKAAACGLEKFVGKAGSDPAASKAIEAFSVRALRGDRSGLTALMTALEWGPCKPYLRVVQAARWQWQ